MDFIAFDIETTGTVAGVDQIVEIAAVKFLNHQVDSVFSTLINPQRPIPPAASAVNKITDDMVRGKPLIESVLEPLSGFCESLPLVAHNAPFDAQFLLSDYQKHQFTAPSGSILDTLPISRKVFPGLANYKLGTLIQFLKLPTKSDFHRAEEDATYCGNLFIEICKRISVGGQSPAIGNLITLTGKPEYKFPLIRREPKQLGFFDL